MLTLGGELILNWRILLLFIGVWACVSVAFTFPMMLRENDFLTSVLWNILDMRNGSRYTIFCVMTWSIDFICICVTDSGRTWSTQLTGYATIMWEQNWPVYDHYSCALWYTGLITFLYALHISIKLSSSNSMTVYFVRGYPFEWWNFNNYENMGIELNNMLR